MTCRVSIEVRALASIDCLCRESAEQAGIDGREPDTERGLTGRDAIGQNHVVPFLEFREELWNEAWRILEIAVQHDREVPLGGGEAGRGCDVLSVIATEADAFDGRMSVLQGGYQRPGMVGAPIVDEDQLVAGRDGAHMDVELPAQLLQAVCAAVYRDDDTYGRLSQGGLVSWLARGA